MINSHRLDGGPKQPDLTGRVLQKGITCYLGKNWEKNKFSVSFFANFGGNACEMAMKMLWLLLFIPMVYSLYGQANKQTFYDQVIFDSDTCCWRKLAEAGEFESAAQLIEGYLKHGRPSNRHSLHWHAGQMHAAIGNNKNALRYFGKTYNVFYKWFGGEDGKSWYYFAKGTSAFIKRDGGVLERMIDKWKRKLEKDGNLKELEFLNNNWDMVYKMIVEISR